MKKLKFTRCILTAGAAVLCAASQAGAQSTDALLDKLVDKGILTVKEANELKAESDKGFTTAYSVKSGMPEWVTSFKINGDLRGRYEGFFNDNDAFKERSRFRYRLRAGFTAVMFENFEAGFRLGSGDLDSANRITSGIDPISNNQTFQNNGSKKGVFLDLAYGKWTPINGSHWNAALTIGKMQNPFVFSDLIFDGDYTPEGAAQQVKWQMTEHHGFQFNLGEFVIDESSGGDDPWLLGSQLRLDSTWSPKLSSSLGAGFLSLQSVKVLTSSSVPDINVGNTRTATRGADGITYTLGAPVYGFNPFVLDAAVIYRFDSAPGYNGAFPVGIFGEYLNNPAAKSGDNNAGWQAGITFGKAGKRKTWEVSYRYKHLEGDAWFEELVDSDSGAFYENAPPEAPAPPASTLRAPGRGYGAGTNIRGHVVKLGYSPFDHVTLNFAWLGMELIEPAGSTADSWMNRIQGDVSLKF